MQHTSNADLGPLLRRARKEKGLRLRQLSAIVGCSESMLSKIENGRVNPSLKTLHNIVKALGTSISGIFAPAEQVRLVARAGSRPLLRIPSQSPGEGIIIERLIPPSSGHRLEANIHIVSPGGGSNGGIGHEGEEVGYILEGELDLDVEGAVYHLEAGDSFFFRSELAHSYSNPGPGYTRVLWVNTPPTF